MADVFCGPLPTNILHESLQDERQHKLKNEQSEEVYRSHVSIEKFVFLKRKNLGGKKQNEYDTQGKRKRKVNLSPDNWKGLNCRFLASLPAFKNPYTSQGVITVIGIQNVITFIQIHLTDQSN